MTSTTILPEQAEEINTDPVAGGNSWGGKYDENGIPFDGSYPGYDEAPPLMTWDDDEIPF